MWPRVAAPWPREAAPWPRMAARGRVRPRVAAPGCAMPRVAACGRASAACGHALAPREAAYGRAWPVA